MNLLSWIIVIVILVWFVIAVIFMWKHKGNCGCDFCECGKNNCRNCSCHEK